MSDNENAALADLQETLERANSEIGHLREENSRLDSYADRRRASTLIREIGKAYRDTVKWGVTAFGLWLAWKSIVEISGKTTEFNVLVDVPFVEVTLPTVSYLPFILAIIVLIRVKNGWKKECEKLVAKYSPYQRIKELESDPNRSSSLLTDEGRTRPEDD